MAANGRHPWKPLGDEVGRSIASHCVAVGKLYFIAAEFRMLEGPRVQPEDRMYEMLPKILAAVSTCRNVRHMLAGELVFVEKLEERYRGDGKDTMVALVAGMRARIEEELHAATTDGN